MHFIQSIFTLCLVTQGLSVPYPVFGTKRYHRAIPNDGLISSQYISNPDPYSSNPEPYYNNVQQQHHQQQQQQQQPQIQPFYYDKPPVYVAPSYQHNTYTPDNSYYYYPRQEYHSYGMPTYRGEYKPSPYYYAPGPSYSYYDDRDEGTNPLDDLHEEMLQEDERERQREMFPVGQESWYEEQAGPEDALTNNFLRNLIAYNRQINAQQQQQLRQQQLQQQQQQQLQQLQQLQQQQLLQNPQLLQQLQPKQQLHNIQPLPIQRDQPSEYDDYSDLRSIEYEYDPQDDSLYDLKKYENQVPHHHEKMTEDDIEDEDERQLKSLAHSNYNNFVNPINKNNKPNYDPNEFEDDSYTNWRKPVSPYAQYDSDPEYDDDSWINWDRKRSNNKNIQKYLVPSKKDALTKVFNDRKSSNIYRNTGKIPTTKKPGPVVATSVSSSSSLTSPINLSTTTTTTTLKPNTNDSKISGQKEIAVPRPAAPSQHIFAAPVVDAISNNARLDLQQTDDDGKIMSKENNDANIYDTIKQLIAMEQNLEKNSDSSKGQSKLQKRFVLNDENLVNELNSLKRRSV